MTKTIRLILGDQLNQNHSWYKQKNTSITYVLMEVSQETNYVKHHIQKVVAFFLAMRNFSNWLIENGHNCIYIKLNESTKGHGFSENITYLIEKHQFKKFEYQLPDEYRLDEQLKKLCSELEIESEHFDTEHFYTTRSEMKDFFENRKSKNWLMESFYREMRKKHQIMVEANDGPLGGKWNYDHSNRKKLPKTHQVIKPKVFEKDVSAIVKLLEEEGIKTIGNVDEKGFVWPTSRQESLELLSFFLENCLALFGDYQDAMTTNQWSLYHSRLSFAMNAKILSPKEVVDQTLLFWEENKSIDISQVEGFIRQIIGWREYVRGIYWAKMPDYEKENQLNNKKKLPDFYWTGKTKMACMKDAIGQSLDYAYAHHIQRLMITGNFALLAGINPDEVDEWYLGIYIDAIQWVELPNTRGMSQWADGGIVATKPYVSSANYISKMGSYCSSCHYNAKDKVGEQSCPFNSLYWNFIDKHIEKWEKNHRMSMMVSSWKNKNPNEKAKLLEQASKYLESINSL